MLKIRTDSGLTQDELAARSGVAQQNIAAYESEKRRASAPCWRVSTGRRHRQARAAHTSAELLESIMGSAIDSPLCMTCGTKMRPAGSCHICEGCGSTSGCN